MSWFSKWFLPQTKYKIIEYSKPRTRIGWNKDIRESVATLPGHPGFQWLIAQLEAQNAMLRTKLVAERHKELKDAEFLQSGIFWSQWLQDMISKATLKINRAQHDSFEDEEKAFNDLQQYIEKVE